MSQTAYASNRASTGAITCANTQEPQSELAFSRYKALVKDEFTQASAISPALFQRAISIKSDTEIQPGGEVTYPIHNALNWKITRFGHQARVTQFGTFLNNEDGSTWQIKLRDPIVDRKNNKLRKYESPAGAGSRAYFPPIDENTRHQIAQLWDAGLITQASFWRWIKEHPEIPIVITEGGKKSLCLLSHGYVAIALYGVNGGYRTQDKLGKLKAPQLIEDLQDICIPGRQVFLAFDQDEKTSTQTKVSGAIAKFGKLLQTKDCQVQVVTWDGKDGKGVDDLIANQGIQAWESAYTAALPLNLWKIAQRLSHQLTEKPQLRLNCPDLAEVQLEILPEEGIIAIASAKGTGKTKFISAQVADSDKALLATHRIALARHLCHRLGIHYRGDLDRAQGQFIADGAYALRVGFCVDSLLAIDPQTFRGCDLIIDEVVQVIRHLLTSSTCNQDGKRPALLAKLRQLLTIARRVIVADADLDDLTLNYLKTLREDDDCFLIRNDYQPQGYPVRFLETPDRSVITHQLLNDLEKQPSGRVLYACTDSKGTSKTLAQLIAVRFPDKRVLLINSETSGGQDEQAFINTPDQVLEQSQYDVIICSPSVATGTSIERQGCIKRVYGIFMGVSSTDADLAQALARVREPVERVVWCVRTGRNYCSVSRATNPVELKGHLYERTETTASLMRCSLKEDTLYQIQRIDWQENPHMNLYAHISAAQNVSMRTLRDALRVRLMLEGHQVQVEGHEAHEGLKVLLKQASDAVKQMEAQDILAAADLSYAQVLVLEQQETLEPQQQHAIRKYYLKEFYCLEALTLEQILADRDGRWRGELLNLEAQLYEGVAQDSTLNHLQRQASWRQGLCPWDIPGTEMRRAIRERLGLTAFIRKALDGWEWTKADVAEIAAQARQFAPAIKAHLNFTIHADVPDVQIVHQLLSQMGLKVEFRWSRHTESFPGEKVRVHRLQAGPLQGCLEILGRRARRREQFLGDGSPVFVIDLKPTGDPPTMPLEQGNSHLMALVPTASGRPTSAILPLGVQWEAQAG